MKIVLADCPAKERAFDAGYPNLGLLYLAGAIRKDFGDDGIQVEYLGPKHDLKSHVAHVVDVAPQVYGISFTSKTATLAFDTIRAVKKALPETWIVCGGPHPTALPEDVLEKAPADVCVLGEGEMTFNEVLKSFSEGATRNDLMTELMDVKGIVYKNNGKIVRTEPRKLISDIDEIAFPAWDLIDFRDYPGTFLKKRQTETSMLISRGCPFDCAFCSNPVWKNAKPWLRHRSVENICEEIKLLYDRGVREIYLSSDEVNFDEKWAIELSEGIVDLGLQDLCFQCNMRVDKVSKRLANALAKMKCWLVHVGIESANDRVLQGIGKHVTVAQVENATRTLSEAGIKIFAFMMLYQAWEDNGKTM